MNLAVNQNIILDDISQTAPQFFPATMASQNITSVATDCQNVLPACTASPLNPFPVGVNVTMEYGQYLDVSPDALTSFYTNSFLGKMSRCALTGVCQKVPEAFQVRTPSRAVCILCFCIP
jgi:hypothetical protein